MAKSPELAQDVRAASSALGSGDLQHAAHHIGVLLAGAPWMGTTRELILRLWEASPDPDAVVPARSGLFHGEAMLRALLLHRAGQPTDALTLVIGSDAVAPEVGYFDVFDEWAADPDLLGKIDPVPIANAALLSMRERRCSARLLQFLTSLAAAWPNVEQVSVALARALRVRGQPSEAVKVAESAHERTPGYALSIALAMAQTEAGDRPSARHSLLRALEFQPRDVGARLDLGDAALDDGQWDEAIRWYEQVLTLEPTNAWARVTSAYARCRTGDQTSFEQLAELARAGDERAKQLYDELVPYTFSLRPPGSALVNAAQSAKGMTMASLALSALEPPSAALAAQRVLGTRKPLPIEVPVPRATPDPRQARAEVAFEVWTYRPEGLFGTLRALTTRARPAVPPPPANIATAIAGLARRMSSTPVSAPEWWAAGQSLGRELGPSSVRDVLAAMVHPTPLSADAGDRLDDAGWIFVTQVTGAFVLAGLDAGWSGSVRKAALLSLLDGPVDWCTTAAILVLVELARNEPTLRREIVTRLVSTIEVPDESIWFGCVKQPVVSRLRTLDGLNEDELVQLHAAAKAF